MDNELKFILWSIGIFIVVVLGAQALYPGGIMALLHYWGK